MVSLRRRRYLGLCSGRGSFPVIHPKPFEHGNAVDIPNQRVNPVSVHPMPSGLQETRDVAHLIYEGIHVGSQILCKMLEDVWSPKRSLYFSRRNSPLDNKCEGDPGTSNAFGSSLPKEEPNDYYPGKETKRRKRHRRKHYEDQEPCIMRGVYFKNMKWQAAIKVDKKQIHLGTVGSQQEAAKLYDRAAFMCGREPNFELSEGEKQELRQYDWEEFLTMTRSAINNKKQQRKLSTGRQKRTENQTPHGNLDHEEATSVSSMSEYDEDVDAETSVL